MSIAAADLSAGRRPDPGWQEWGWLAPALAVLLAAATMIAVFDRAADPMRAVCRQPAPLMVGHFLLH